MWYASRASSKMARLAFWLIELPLITLPVERTPSRARAVCVCAGRPVLGTRQGWQRGSAAAP